MPGLNPTSSDPTVIAFDLTTTAKGMGLIDLPDSGSSLSEHNSNVQFYAWVFNHFKSSGSIEVVQQSLGNPPQSEVVIEGLPGKPVLRNIEPDAKYILRVKDSEVDGAGVLRAFGYVKLIAKIS